METTTTQTKQAKWEVIIERAIIAAYKEGDMAEAERLLRYLQAQREVGM